MKRINYFALALSLAVVPVSCSESFSVEVTPAEPDMITFTCILEDDGTKLGIDENGKTKWEPTDAILVHGNNAGVVVTLTESDISNEGRTATISVPGNLDAYPKGLSTYYAAYPASAVDESVTKPYFYSVFKNTNLPLMVAYDKGDNVFRFENVCGIIAFTIPSGHDFDSYIFTGNNSETLGYGKYTVGIYQNDEETVSRTFPRSDAGWTNGPLTQLSGTVVCNGTTLNKVFIPIPSGGTRVNLTSGFTIKLVKNEDVVKTLSTSTSITLHRQEMIKIGSLPVD